MGDQGPRRRRPVLLAFVVIVGAVAAIGGATAIFLYDRATAIDRSTPAVVVEQLLQAALAENDPARVRLFTCDEWPPDEALDDLREDLGPEVRVSWAPLSTSKMTDSLAEVSVRIRYVAGTGGTSAVQVSDWRIRTIMDDGWRACGVQKP